MENALRTLRRYIMDTVYDNYMCAKGIDVIISKECSVKKWIKKNVDKLPRAAELQAADHSDIAVYAPSRRAITIRGVTIFEWPVTKPVISLVFPYTPDCIVVTDKEYRSLAEEIRTAVAETGIGPVM